MKKLLLLLSFALTLTARAQFTNDPKTLFEMQFHMPNVTLVRGMAVVPAAGNLFLDVRAEKLTTLPDTVSTMAISLRGRASNYTDVDYIDYDEIDGLIAGIRYIAQAGHSVSTMEDFEVTYRTRSGFSISKTSTGNNAIIVVRSGRTDSQRVQIENYVLNDLAGAIVAAKAKLDGTR